MRSCVSSKFRVVAVLLSIIFIFTACSNSVDFNNPNKAIDAYVNGQNIVGLTVNVTASISEAGSSDSVTSFYSEGYNGSFIENVLVFGRGAVSIEKGKTYTIRITEVRKSSTTSNSTYVIIGDFV